MPQKFELYAARYRDKHIVTHEWSEIEYFRDEFPMCAFKGFYDDESANEWIRGKRGKTALELQADELLKRAGYGDLV